jgi:TetR/AcrR family transcriptional regulator
MAGERKQAILEALARELEERPGSRITTAGLARAVGVSEAALYRHFPSKARMYEGLISFAEDGIFSRINQIMEEDRETRQRCARVLYLLLGFAERNPGIVRVLLGDALVGEHERLHERIQAFFERLQMQFRQILREARLREDAVLSVSSEAAAEILVVYVEGRMQQFLRTRFDVSPLSGWEADWGIIDRGIFS